MNSNAAAERCGGRVRDGFVGGPFDNFMKWNKERYKTIDDVHKKAPIEKHAVHIDTAGVFASGAAVPADE